jgi:subtilisin family serine protease
VAIEPRGPKDPNGGSGTDHQRMVEQARLILGSVEGSAAWPPGWADEGIEYLYRTGRVLVRDRDLARVQEVVGGTVVDANIRGLTALELDGEVPRLLEELDRRLGKGVATPDHVMWVTVQCFCPAVEPSVPPKGAADPVPGAAGEGCSDECDGEGVRVSVVDTGWWPPAEAAHPWLAGVTGDAENPFGADGEILPYGGHGTFAAGVVRATAPKTTVNVEGILHPPAKDGVVPAEGLASSAGAWFESDIVSQLYDSLAWAPDIISLQAGTTTRSADVLLSFQILYEERLAHMPGTVLLAAAGNDSSPVPFWPAAFPWATAVGGLTEDESARASWSNFGPWVDVYARGEDFRNAYVTGTFTTREPETPAGEKRTFDGMAIWSGTSFSTPYVAGMVAARMSRTGESARQALDVILKLARTNGLPKVGPVAKPWMACPDNGDDGRKGCGCGCGCSCCGG